MHLKSADGGVKGFLRTLQLGVIIAASLLSTISANAANEIFIDRMEERGNILVPLRGIFEALGASVHWDAVGQAIDISFNTRKINMFVNDYQAYVNGKLHRMVVPPRSFMGRVCIPLRFVGEALGGKVTYRNSVVTIKAPGAAELKVHLLASRKPAKTKLSSPSYIAAWTNKRAATKSDMTGNSNWELTLMREEIGARKGKPFHDDFIRAYFLRQSWYHQDDDYTPAWLSSIELQNIEFIGAYQQRVYGGSASHP